MRDPRWPVIVDSDQPVPLQASMDGDTLMSFKKKLARIPVLGQVLVFGYRFKMALGYYTGPLWQIIVWMFKSNEYDNYTYQLDDTNKAYLAAFVADITGQPHEEIAGYICELENDRDIPEHVRRLSGDYSARRGADTEARYGRRLGWYAFVRATKPRIVVETGVHNGLGACVLTSALMRNAAEGSPGYYYGTEINPQAGFLLTGKYAECGKILYGDSIETLSKFDKTIDLMVNDSDHSAEYEGREYDTIERLLDDGSIILGDNAHTTDRLLEFARKTGRLFQFFREKPKNHWYPGAGIGVAFRRERVDRGAGQGAEAAGQRRSEHAIA